MAEVAPKLFGAKCSFPVRLTLEPDRGYNPGGVSRAETETSGLRRLRSGCRADLASGARHVVRLPLSQRRDRNTLRTLALLRRIWAGVSVGARKNPGVAMFRYSGVQVVGGGLERDSATAVCVGTCGDERREGTPSDAVDDAISPDLSRLAQLWPMLCDETRREILGVAEDAASTQATS